jgi:hypothetical protein
MAQGIAINLKLTLPPFTVILNQPLKLPVNRLYEVSFHVGDHTIVHCWAYKPFLKEEENGIVLGGFEQVEFAGCWLPRHQPQEH